MTSRLQGTVALITGASSGIGAATALALAAEGATVAISARRRDRLDELAGRIRGDGGTALVLESDITVEEQARGVVDQTVAELGRLDILINNAGLMLLGPLVEADADEWSRMLQLNVLSLLWCSQQAIPHLEKAAAADPRRVADLVNISSVAGRIARTGSAVYNATKFGVVGLSEGLRQELAAKFVRVSVVEPGVTRTELAGHNREDVLAGMDARFGDIQRLESEDIADAIHYVVTRPRHVAVGEILIRPSEQA